MAGVRGRSGGARPNSGPKPRAQESDIRAALHAAVAPADVHKALAEAVRAGAQWAITLYLAYDWGKPRESVNLSARGTIATVTAQVSIKNDPDELAQFIDAMREAGLVSIIDPTPPAEDDALHAGTDVAPAEIIPLPE